MACRWRFGSKKRDYLWSRECAAACKAGRGNLPICNLCDQPVAATDPWHESHLPWRGAPAHLRSVGIAHERCNLVHGRTVVVPALAKAARVRKLHLGLKRPGEGRHPLPAGVNSRITKTLRGRVLPRLSGAQKHARLMAKRAILTTIDEGAVQ